VSGLNRRVSRFFAAGFLLVLAACVETGPPAPDLPPNRDTLRALRWIAPSADKVRALTTEPVACRNPHEAMSRIMADNGPSFSTVDIGQLAFESPALLGGAAARMGLSCSSCHLNGRNNPDFFVEGVSGSPGTADVTNSLFSKTRGNGAFDPTPIPDIAARDGKQIKTRLSPEFDAKVHGLIVDEFDGRQPGEDIFRDVVSYMDGLVPCADPGARQPVTASKDMIAARKAFLIASFMDTPDEKRLMARAARERLERLNERFIAANQSEVRAALLDASQKIATWMDAPSAEGESAVQVALKTAAERVKRDEPRSLYNPDVLRAALER
jgi:hypothetical protein